MGEMKKDIAAIRLIRFQCGSDNRFCDLIEAEHDDGDDDYPDQIWIINFQENVPMRVSI